MIAISDSHHWFGCWWEPVWCCYRWNCVSYSVFSMHLFESCYVFFFVVWTYYMYRHVYCVWLLFLFFRGQALCTTAAVIGGKSLASQISEKIVIMAPCIFLHGIFGMLFLHYVSQSIFDVNVVPFAIQVALSGGVLFIVFGIQSFLSTVE